MKKRLNKYWRVIATGTCFGLFGIGAAVLSIVFALLVRWMPVQENQKQRWLLASIRGLSASLLSLFQLMGLMNFSRHGPSIYSLQGHLIVANHSSLVDALFVIADCQDLCCIVKAELLSNPFTRYIVKLAGYIPNNSDTLLTDSTHALASGKNLLIFPEGTRNTSDDQLEFKRGAANIALSADCPITPVILNYRPRALQKGDKWYCIPESAPRVAMTTYPALNSLHYIDQRSPVTMQARQLNSGIIEFFRRKITGINDQCPVFKHRATADYPIGQIGE